MALRQHARIFSRYERFEPFFALRVDRVHSSSHWFGSISFMGRTNKFRALVVLTAAAALGACSLVPTSGPASYEIKSERRYEPDSLPYEVVRITPQVEGIVAEFSPRISGTFPDRRVPKELRFGIGDIVAVSIFEAASGGLFIPAEASVRPGNFISLPNQAVDSNGYISVPYAGPILAKGRTPPEVQTAIVNALKNRAIDPQAVVTLVEQRTSLISVLGEVGIPLGFQRVRPAKNCSTR